MSQQIINLTSTEALKILNKYSCLQIKTVNSTPEKDTLRAALLLIVNLSEHENLGICADNLTQGLMALSSYLKAFGYDYNLENVSNDDDQNPVYIKFNTQKMSYYIDHYTGSYRGVLVSCYAEEDDIVGTYGHFPLDLFFAND